MYTEPHSQRCGRSSPCVCTHKGWVSAAAKGAPGNAAGVSGSPVCNSAPTDPASQQHPSRAGSVRVDVPVPSAASRPWELTRVRGNPSNLATRPAREISRICVGPITKRGQYLQAAPCSSSSGLCREKERGGCVSLGHGSAALPLPSHGCILLARTPVFCWQSSRSLCSFSPRTRCE